MEIFEFKQFLESLVAGENTKIIKRAQTEQETKMTTSQPPKNQTKKLINSAENSAWDGLSGLVSWNPGLALMPGFKDVVLRRDWQEVKKAKKVSMITGGGSGHEPMWAGYVGKNMLTAAVHGNVFAAPTAKSIFATLLHLGKDNPAGILVVFCNYTGDRLNFGTAVEKARVRGVKVEIVRFEDDCALGNGWKAINRRGLAGFTLLLKVVGHMAETGEPLDKVAAYARETVANISTMGVAWASCSLPGAGPLFQMDEDKMELGLGIHGEAGIKRVKMDNTSNTVNSILSQMLNKEITPPLNNLKKGCKVVVLLNNLGATTDLEMNVLAKEVVAQLDAKHGLIVERILAGRYVTSLEMAGISISIMLTDDFKNTCIDAPTTAQGWMTPCLLSSGHPMSINSHMETVAKELADHDNDPLKKELKLVAEKVFKGPVLTLGGHQLLQKCMTNVANRFVAHKDLLNTWDAVTGDGDCGNTLASAAKGLFSLISEKKLEGVMNVCNLLEILANTMEDYMGGTSGGIYSLMLTSMSQQLSTEAGDKVTSNSWVKALRKGLDTIVKYGGAEPGSRTMVDSLNAVVLVLETGDKAGVVQMWQQAAKAADEAAKATLDMKAKAGRAVYVDPSLLVHPDPGAKAVAVWVGAIVSTVAENQKLLE